MTDTTDPTATPITNPTPHYSLTMSNLIPTPRTDKNGRTITRHMKPTQATTPPTRIPPVTTTTGMSHQDKSELADVILTQLDVNRFDTTKPPYSNFHPLANHNGLTQDLTGNDLKKILKVTASLQGRGHTAARLMLGKALGTNNTTAIQAIITDREWLAKNPVFVPSFIQFTNALQNENIITADNPEELSKTAKHLAVAYRRLKDYEYPKDSHTHGLSEFKNREYLSLLLDNPDHLESLLEYRHSRGMDQSSTMEPHNPEDFAEYLSHNQLNDGWL